MLKQLSKVRLGILSLLVGLVCLVPFQGQANEFKQIVADEGLVYEVYLGPRGYLHAGVGHRLPEDGTWKLGDKVDLPTIATWFWDDFREAQRTSEKFAPRAPMEVRNILTNMAFNMGEPTLFTFKRLREAVEEENWFEAAYEMQESLWYHHVGHRSKRLVARMLSYGRAVSGKPQ